ncbi:MAG: MFS transporter [Sphingomonas adhaesiva]|uniref:MFS transporter n=1 Tax=Sphingomonas adhaesiva TaxID=28212 RepID=UPI002FF964C6
MAGLWNMRRTARPADDVAAGEWRRGWPIVAAAMLGSGLGPGLYQNLSSLFVPGLERDMGWSRGDIATAAGVGMIGALAAPAIGRAADRLGVRPVVVASMLVLALGYLWLASVAGALWHYTVGVMLVVLALPGTSSLSFGKLIAARFVAHRGMALAFGTSGLAAMTVVVAPLLGVVIDAYGWRAALVAMGVASLAVALPPILLAIRDAPLAEAPPAGDAAPAPVPPGMTAAQARRDPRFWLLIASAVLINFATTGLVTQMVPIGIERGLPAAEAALLLTGFGVSAIAGRILVGVLVDRLPAFPVAGSIAIVSAAAFLLLGWAPGGLATLLAIVFLCGLMNGAENDLLPFLAARLFGLRAFAEIYGTAMPIALAGSAIGIVGFGRLHDHSGSYALALAAGSGALLLAAGCFVALSRVGTGRG